MRTTLLSFLFLPLFFVSALGQSTTTVVPITPPKGAAATGQAPANSASDYSSEPIVIEQLDNVYKMAADGTGSKLTTVRARVQSEAAAKQLGIVGIAYASNSEHVEFSYVRVRHPNGSVTETPVSGAMDMPAPITQQAPFYSDLKQVQVPVRGLQPGDTLEWEAKSIRTKAETPEEFWGTDNFTEDGVVLSQTIELHVPKDIYVNVWSPKNKPTETVEGSERIFRWASSQKKPTVGKEADAEKELKKKQVWTVEQELDAKEGKLPSVAWTTFKSWEAVGAWYQGLEGDRIVPDAAVKAKVAEVTAGKTTEEQKVRAVYGYVATQIRYIGVAFGIGRYQPHHAAEVLENQYGDCKDKHTLLAAMLTTLGLHPNAALIGAGVRFNEAVPSPGSFNHLITTVQVGGKTVWLDSTEEVAPYDALAYLIRDKRALVVPDAGVAKIEATPVTLPFPSFQKLDAVGTLDKEGTSNSRLAWAFRGDEEIALRTAFRQVSPAQYDQMVQQISQGIGYAGTANHAEVSRPEDTTEPMTMSYDYKREKSGDWENLKIVPQLAPVTLPQLDEKEPPVQSIALGVPRVETSNAAMKLPDGWGVELPEAVHTKSAYATYDETYRFDKGTVYVERRVEVLKEKVPVADWKSYKKFADDADLAHDQWIQLVTNELKVETEKKMVVPDKAKKTEPWESYTAANTEAAKLIKSAYEAIGHHELDQAKLQLDQAKDLNPNQPFLWSTYGNYEFSRGEISESIVCFKKELELHPYRYDVYGAIANTQTILGHRPDAKETLRSWAKRDESNPQPTIALMAMLMDDGDAAGAVVAAEAGIAQLPEEKKKDERLQLMLGRAQIVAGMKEKGHDTLLALMKTTESPDMMNDSAYELADAGLELILAESTTRTALGKMSDESKGWTLDESPQTLLAKSRMTVATWDTMGWILYREGKLEEAESYLKAAWLNAQSVTMAEHLGEVAVARGKKDEALTTYELGLATISPYDMMGKKKPAGAEEKKLQGRADALRKAGAHSSVHDATSQLRVIRTIPLGAAKGLDGVAEYRLLLSGGKVVRAEKTGTKELVGAEDRLKEAKLNQFWPAESEANLVRNGMLNCHSGVCELVLEP
jgi:tetratricopeptide (TPR) repeat protein